MKLTCTSKLDATVRIFVIVFCHSYFSADMADADDSNQMESDSAIQGASNLPLGLGNPQHRYHTAPGDFGGPMRPLSVLLPGKVY